MRWNPSRDKQGRQRNWTGHFGEDEPVGTQRHGSTLGI
jgi:hypothetical protein